MIKAEELRVGNWYTSTKWQHPVMCQLSDIAEIHHRLEGAEEKYANVDEIFQPIPLTEEWLLSFGFCGEINPRGRCGNFYLDYNAESGCHGMVIWYQQGSWCFSYHNRMMNVKYVHQLQSLYFLLNNKELTIID